MSETLRVHTNIHTNFDTEVKVLEDADLRDWVQRYYFNPFRYHAESSLRSSLQFIDIVVALGYNFTNPAWSLSYRVTAYTRHDRTQGLSMEHVFLLPNPLGTPTGFADTVYLRTVQSVAGNRLGVLDGAIEDAMMVAVVKQWDRLFHSFYRR